MICTNKHFPRVLVISGEPFNTLSATGITISNLFRGWPINNIAQIYSANITPDNTICRNYWKFNNSDLIILSQCLNIIKNISHINANKKYACYVESSAIAEYYSRKSLVRRILAPWLDLMPYHLSLMFFQWLEEFKPELIYSTLASIRMVTAVQKISRRLKIPLVPHFMDDWLTTYSANGKSIFTTFQRIILRNMTTQLLKDVPLGLGICDAMATEYSQYFQQHFEAFMNPVEVILEYPVSKREIKNAETPVRFVYVGGLHLSRYNNLKDIGNVISILRKEGHNVELHIYAPSRDVMQHGSFLEFGNSVKVCGTISPNDVQNILSQYDVAVHVESFSKQLAIYTKLSLSTKIPQYLAAGLPILAYGPADIASCRYVYAYECGKIVDKQDLKALEKTIYELASNTELRLKLGLNSWNVAKDRHDIHKEQERFRKVLQEVTARMKA